MEGVILSLALLIFLAHLFSALFVKTRVPEVLPLMLLGIIIGPILKIVSSADFGMVDKVFTRILLIVILFESGLGIRISHIRGAWIQSSRMTLIGFPAIMFAVAVLARVALGIPFAYCLILGCVLAENSFAVIIPLISKLNISNNIKTLLLVESTAGSVLAIAGATTMLHMARSASFSPSGIIAGILYNFSISFIIGTAAAVFWTAVLSNVRKLENCIFLTLAFVLVVYSACEAAGADGVIGSFIFGIIAGNIRIIRKLHGFRFIEFFISNAKSKAFNEVEKSFFAEVVFILRTFFFVYIGICMHINSLTSMFYGILFTTIIFLVRIPMANYALGRSINRADTAVVAAMAPKGLVTAVLASLVMQSGIAGTDTLQDIIYSVILFSIIFSTIFAFLIEKGYIAKTINFIFKRHIDTMAE
ncbi:MAG: cation:proton antiporter [Elusimicrobiota bacterium]|jgi:NhaP-type Na+/H+ or K+/H+ antiporter|nr:cation:proton antiporter [Elusimicrobiota bacterium]